MGTIKATNIEPIADNGTVTLGSSGDTFSFASGVTNSLNYPAFSVQPSSDQTVAINTWTKVSFGTENYDTDNAFASDKFTVPSGKGGKYCFIARITIGSNDDKTYSIKLYKNGSNRNETFYRQVTGGGSSVASTATTHILDLDATDYVEVYINHSSGSSKAIESVNTIFQGYLIGS